MRTVKRVVLIILFISIVGVAIYNCILDKNQFLKTSVGNSLTLIVALLISYYFSKTNQDEKNKKDIYLDLMRNMQKLVTDDCMTNISITTDIDYVLMRKRQLNNYMDTLKKHSKEFYVEEDVAFIEKEINEYMEIIGNHQHDKDYLAKSRKELERPLKIVESKLFDAMLKLYQ